MRPLYYAAGARLRATVSVAVLSSFLASCAALHTAVPPQSNAAALARSAGPVAQNRFAQARGKILTSEQISSYIDPSVTGSDRTLAQHLMSMMPSNRRADFIYMSSNGHLVSNNPALLQYVTVLHSTLSMSNAARASLASSRKRQPSDYSSFCSPPNPASPANGAYVRQVSLCGFAGGWGFVNVPCGTTSLQSGESGNVYFELTGLAGSEVEGGMFTLDGYNFDPYLRSTAWSESNGYETLIDGATRFTCGQNVAIWHGITQDGQFTYTQVGSVDGIDPESTWIDETIIHANPAAWLFGPVPTDVEGQGTDPAGHITPCMYCSISQVTSLAQRSQTYIADGSYFGVNTANQNAINWLEVSFGDWANNCVPNTTLCTFLVSFSPLVYYGGPQYYPDAYVAQSNYGPTNYGPYETFDGIALPGGTYSSTAQRDAQAAISEPLPPVPTPTPVPLIVEDFHKTGCLNVGTTAYFPGQVDPLGRTVPAGYEYVWTITLAPRCPAVIPQLGLP